MIIFKERQGKRINPFNNVKKEYVSDATETLVKGISIDNKEDRDNHRNSKYDLNNLNDEDTGSKDRNFIQKESCTRRKNKRISDCPLNCHDYSVGSPTMQEKRRRISEDDEPDNDDAYDYTDHVIQGNREIIAESGGDNGDQGADDDNTEHVHSPRQEKRQIISESGTNNLKSLETSNGQHFPSQIPPTDKKKYPQKRCIICRGQGVRNDTRYFCNVCHVALCKDPCFREYHSI